MLLYVKIPCMLVAMVGLHVAVTPPNPPPHEDEKVESTSLEVIIKQRRINPLIIKSVGWVATIAEASVILSLYAPSSAVSRAILSTIVFIDGGEQRIRASPLFFAGAFLTTLGGLIRGRCYRELGTLFTYEMSIRKDHRLITSGPYAVVRHPGYTALLMAMGGSICLHAGAGSWIRESGVLTSRTVKGVLFVYIGIISSVLVGVVARMSKEDEALHKRFGEKWEEWAHKVPYCLIPFIY